MVFSHWDCSLTRNTGFCLRTKDILCITLSGKRLNVVYVVIDFISLQTRELWFARKNAVSNQERRHFPEGDYSIKKRAASRTSAPSSKKGGK